MKPILRFSLLLIPLILIGLAGYFYFTSPALEHVLETNVTPVSSTLTWYTKLPTRGCALVLALPPRLVCANPKLAPPQRTNHHLTLNHLKPDKIYPIILVSRFKFGLYTINKKFIPDTIPGTPNPAYGQIILPFSQNVPADYATVIAFTSAGPVSTLTNSQGRFTLDLKGTYKPNTPIPITIFWQSTIITGQEIHTGTHQPLPILVLREPWSNQ